MLSAFLEWAVVAMPTALGIMQLIIPVWKQPTRTHRVCVLVGCVLFSGLIWLQQHQARREHAIEVAALPTREQFDKLNKKLADSEAAQKRMILNLSSKHPLLDALSDIAQNPVAIEGPDFDLESSKSALDNRRFKKEVESQTTRLKSMEAVENARIESAPAFDYAVTTLSMYLAALGKNIGDKATSTYKGLPASWQPKNDFAVIALENNSSWKFSISLLPYTGPPTSRTLSIKIQCPPITTAQINNPPQGALTATILYNPLNKRLATRFTNVGKESYNDEFDLGEYKTKLNELLKIMIGAQHESHPISQSSSTATPTPTPPVTLP